MKTFKSVIALLLAALMLISFSACSASGSSDPNAGTYTALTAEMLGVSRPVVREGLKSLKLLGVVTTVHGGGNYVADHLDTCLIRPLSILFALNNSNVLQSQQLRAALERQAAALLESLQTAHPEILYGKP